MLNNAVKSPIRKTQVKTTAAAAAVPVYASACADEDNDEPYTNVRRMLTYKSIPVGGDNLIDSNSPDNSLETTSETTSEATPSAVHLADDMMDDLIVDDVNAVLLIQNSSRNYLIVI